MATRIRLRHDTAANWSEQNPILALGETGFETDTRMVKLGDGATRWADLKYAVTGDLQVTDDTIHGDMSVSLSSGVGDRNNWVALIYPTEDGTVNTPVNAYTDGVAYDSQGNAFVVYWYGVNGNGCAVTKFSPAGEVLFSNYYNQFSSYGFGIAVDKEDNLILLLGEESGTNGTMDTVLLKLWNDDGSIIWQKNLDSLGSGDDWSTCIDVDAQNDIFIVGSIRGDGSDCWVGKFRGTNGNSVWQKKYDVDGFDDYGTGLAVDKDGNLAVVGTTRWQPGPTFRFVPIFKLSGLDGSIMWATQIVNARWDNGNNYTFGNVMSSDICADSQGNFYFGMTMVSEYYPGSTQMLTKISGSNGKILWTRQIGQDQYLSATGSVICDDQDNVYLSTTTGKHNTNYDTTNTNRHTQHITKFNTTGAVIWQRWVAQEQFETVDPSRMGVWWWGDENMLNGQSIRVNKDYVLLGGYALYQYAYNSHNEQWYTQPYLAQVNRDGSEFEINGWSFKASDLKISWATAQPDDGAPWGGYDPAGVSNLEVTITTGSAGYEMNTDPVDVSYINTSRINKVTFSEKTLRLPSGGIINVSRELKGHITAIGNFDGPEGSNWEGNVWLNGSDRDEKGASYAAGGWYNNTGSNWNDNYSYRRVPLVFKTDAEGKLVWQAGNALDQTYGVDYVDVAYHQATNTVIALGNDGEMDGSEGFNILYLDADSGSMKQDITHIRPSSQEQNHSSDMYPQALRVMSDGSPVVAGYINSAYDEFANVTGGDPGLAGSGNSFLVIPRDTFVRTGKTTEYPTNDGSWYIYPNGSSINRVNSYGYDESVPATAYTGTLGSGATISVSISGGVLTASIGNSAGTGYKAGQQIRVGYAAIGGSNSGSDLYVFIEAVDGAGAITTLNGTHYINTIPGDGLYNDIPAESLAPTDFTCEVDYADGEHYNVSIQNSGYYYGVGDTFKILGTALGGTTPANDLIITVTGVSGSGVNAGNITGVTASGTPQSTNIRLHDSSGSDYSQAGNYNIVHELNADGFIWTPNWSFTGGSPTSSSYDYFYGIALDSSDNVIAGGYIGDTGLNYNTTVRGDWDQTAITAKFDGQTGEVIWATSVDGSEGNGNVWSVAVDSEDNVYSAMTGGDERWRITKQNSAGEFVWQIDYYMNGSVDTVSIAITDKDEVVVAGYSEPRPFRNDYHHYNYNVVVLKLDKDGNQQFARGVWSTHGVRWNRNDSYSGQLTVKGDRYTIVGHSDDPGDNNYQGIVIDMPLDGSGVGVNKDFHYEAIELERHWRLTENQFNSNPNRYYVTPIQLHTRATEFINSPYTDSWINASVYGDRDYKTYEFYKPEGGSIEGVSKIVFEDGSEQTSSMQGLPQVDQSVSNGYRDYWLRPEDNGKHLWQKYNYAVVIPDNNRYPLPIGYAVTIITDYNEVGIRSEDENDYVIGSGISTSGEGSYYWTIPHYTMVTLVKIDNGRWMLAGPGIRTGW